MLATEFSIDLAFVAASLEKMKELQENELPAFLKEHGVNPSKQQQILELTSKRTLQGALS